jgi:hypothetical protein
MKRVLGLAVATAILLVGAAVAAPQNVRVRGAVAAITGDILLIHTAAGADVQVTLASDTAYLQAQPAGLGDIGKGSYVGVASKNVGSVQVALGVGIFPPSMRGAAAGSAAWDRITDTTLSGGTRTNSSMTNGSVEKVDARAPAPSVSSTMTNGDVTAAASQVGARKLMLTYQGGQQTILVPPTAPIVIFKTASRPAVARGESVFVVATSDQGKITAHLVAVGANGVKTPF